MFLLFVCNMLLLLCLSLCLTHLFYRIALGMDCRFFSLYGYAYTVTFILLLQ